MEKLFKGRVELFILLQLYYRPVCHETQNVFRNCDLCCIVLLEYDSNFVPELQKIPLCLFVNFLLWWCFKIRRLRLGWDNGVGSIFLFPGYKLVSVQTRASQESSVWELSLVRFTFMVFQLCTERQLLMN